MAKPTTSCDCASPEHAESILALVVQGDGEDRWSKVFRVTNLLGAGSTPHRAKLFELHAWITHLWRSGEGVVYLSDDSGEVHELRDGRTTSRVVAEGTALACVWGASDREVYAAGDAGIVFRWDGEAWAAISEPLGGRLFGVTRAGDGALYVCGQGGLWRRTGTAWSKIALPTERRLTAIAAMPDGTVWVCGEGGTLVRGSADTWEELRLTQTDLHGACWFKGRVYLAGGRDGVLRYDDGRLEAVKPTVVSYGVVADGEHLVSYGDKIAIRFNGEAWAGLRFD